IEFDIDKADIRPEFHNEVAKVGDFMKNYPTTTAAIEGHSDKIGNAAHNIELSRLRAESVVSYLVDKFGIERSRLSAKGHGHTRPVTDNSSQEGKQKNRRIEAIIDCAFDVKEVKPPEQLCMLLQVKFASDSADVKPEYHDEIARVGEYMKKYPTTTAVIEGHTDKVGSSNLNLETSQRRAESVVNYLVEKCGIDSSRLSAKGYGSTRPVVNNSTEAGRQKNRRIEAIIDCAFDVKEVVPPERLCMALQIEFDTASADIRPESRDEIAKVAEYLKKYPTATAIIEGHTDNVGGYDYNMKLSNKRAENVVLYLIGNFGSEPSRLSASGYGSTRRVAYNNTPEGRQKNRRINAIIDCVIEK